MNKEILRLALPNILSNISIPLLSTVDTVLMGSLSAGHLGAVGVGGMIFNFIYWNFGFLRMGTTGMTAQAFGAKDPKEQIHTFLRAGFLAVIIAILLLLLMRPIEYLSLMAFNMEGGQAELVSEYFRIRIWAAPASLLIYVIAGWYFGMQNAFFPLIITLTVNIANMLISIYLVKYLNWGIQGVALGTVIAQYLGLVVAVILFLWKYVDLKSQITKQWNQIASFTKFLKINGDIFLRTVCLTFAFGFFYSKSAEAGEIILAVNVVLQQFLNWMSYGVDGFAYAAESMVGKYLGAKDEDKTYQSIKLAFKWGFILALIFSIYFLFAYLDLIHLFTDQEEVIQASLDYKYWMAAFPIVAFACYIWDGIYIGLTASVSMRNSMLASLVVYLLAYYVLLPYTSDKAIWIALMIFLVARGIFQGVLFARNKLALR